MRKIAAKRAKTVTCGPQWLHWRRGASGAYTVRHTTEKKRVWTHDCFGHATTYARPSAGAEKHFAPEDIILKGGYGERLRRNECCRRHRVKKGPSQFIARYRVRVGLMPVDDKLRADKRAIPYLGRRRDHFDSLPLAFFIFDGSSAIHVFFESSGKRLHHFHSCSLFTNSPHLPGRKKMAGLVNSPLVEVVQLTLLTCHARTRCPTRLADACVCERLNLPNIATLLPNHRIPSIFYSTPCSPTFICI